MAPVDIQPGALSHDLPCSACGHSMHSGYCRDDLGDGVTCPCHCPVPGIY